MKKAFTLIFLLTACTVQEKKNQVPFPILTTSEDEWANYEGRWQVKGGILRFELSLKTGVPGIDSYYKLTEWFESDSVGMGATHSENLYSSYKKATNGEFGICLHELAKFSAAGHFRYKKSSSTDEIFFITRGSNELLPCDDDYKPLTTDARYTLHKRSKPFTVEGYITFDKNSAVFYERNTSEHWKVASLGEFEKLRLAYEELAKEKFEGVYLKALAYSVSDSTAENNLLVIKKIKNLGKDSD